MNTTSGRGRVNIHAALNLENFDTPFVAPDTVNGTSAAQLLAKIEARNKKINVRFTPCGTTPPTIKAQRSANFYPAPNAPSILSNCHPIAPI